MGNTLAKWKSTSPFYRAFWILAFVFLLLGVGTLGSFRSVGGAYELKAKGETDALQPAIVFDLDQIEVEKEVKGTGSTTTTQTEVTKLRLTTIYLSVGAVYAEPGEVATLRFVRSSSNKTFSTSASYRIDVDIENLLTVERYDEKGELLPEGRKDAIYNWISIDVTKVWKDNTDRNISPYEYYKLTAQNCNVLLNEVIFVGEKLKDDGASSGETCVIPTKISEGEATILPVNQAAGETRDTALKAASALLDSQESIPSLAQSSFFRLGGEEVYSMMTVAQMRAGSSYSRENIGFYLGDKIYNSLGVDFIALGTLIFGMSPFGLRIFPMLASFGVLVVGYLLARRLTKSDKAAFVFAMLYALSSITIGFGHLGTPLMIGVFFFTMSLYFCHSFYAKGLKNADIQSAIPLALSGLFGALAICVNGAYVLPMAGVVLLFVFGMLRQQTARKYYLEKATAELEAATPETKEECELKVVNTHAEYRAKNLIAPVVFGLFLLLGTLLVAVLAVLPASYGYVRIYGDPSNPLGVFALAWKAFAGGFVGVNEICTPSSWSLFYRIFTGVGVKYAVTGIAINAVAALAGLAAIVYAVYRIVVVIRNGSYGKKERAELRSIIIPLAGIVLSLVTAAFAKGGPAFVLLAWFFAFLLAGNGAKFFTEQRSTKKIAKIVLIVAAVLLVLCFLLFAICTFSLPLPASFMDKIFA